MTTKEASERFHIPERAIRKLAQERKIVGVQKVMGCYILPDETPIIITDSMARAFLLKVLRVKNNPNEIISTHELRDATISRAWYDYVLTQEVVGDCEYTTDPRELLSRMQLTEKGMTQVLGKKTFLNLKNLNVSPNINIGGVVVNT